MELKIMQYNIEHKHIENNLYLCCFGSTFMKYSLMKMETTENCSQLKNHLRCLQIRSAADKKKKGKRNTMCGGVHNKIISG
jgi:hypothetical protein